MNVTSSTALNVTVEVATFTPAPASRAGASFVAVTVIVTIAVSDKLPSETVYPNVSDPSKLFFGRYVYEPSALTATVPPLADAASLPTIVIASPSASVSFESSPPAAPTLSRVSSTTVSESFCAFGASLTEFTVTVTVVALVMAPSVTVYVNESTPLQFVAGL